MNAAVRRTGLLDRTRYCPWTLRGVPPCAVSLAGRALREPRLFLQRSVEGWRRSRPLRRNVVDLARAVLLPRAEPDLCLVHNLATAEAFDFLRELYPHATIGLYFHGGEVPSGAALSDEGSLRAFASVDWVATNTEFSRAQAVARGCPREKVFVCPVGFCLEDFSPPSPKRFRQGGVLRLLSVGRAAPEKGLEHAVKAMAMLDRRGLRAVRYRIVGDGPSRPLLEKTVARLGLSDRVELVGERPHHALLDEYRAADVLVLPSVQTVRWAETQACVVQEAMLMKLLVISTTAGGVPECLAPQLRFLSAEPARPDQLAERITTVAALDERKLQALAEAGRRYAERRFDIRRLNARLLDRATSPNRRPATRSTSSAP